MGLMNQARNNYGFTLEARVRVCLLVSTKMIQAKVSSWSRCLCMQERTTRLVKFEPKKQEEQN